LRRPNKLKKQLNDQYVAVEIEPQRGNPESCTVGDRRRAESKRSAVLSRSRSSPKKQKVEVFWSLKEARII
jgi:hypothetical protein